MQVGIKFINSKFVTLPPSQLIKTSSWHLFPLKMNSISEATELVHHLQENKINASSNYYSKSMGMEPALDGIKGEKVVANSWAGKTVCIPITPFLTAEDVRYISSQVNSFNLKQSITHENRPLIS